jgi:hypothetical protein
MYQLGSITLCPLDLRLTGGDAEGKCILGQNTERYSAGRGKVWEQPGLVENGSREPGQPFKAI